MDSASDSGSEGWGFESLLACHLKKAPKRHVSGSFVAFCPVSLQSPESGLLSGDILYTFTRCFPKASPSEEGAHRLILPQA